MHEGTSLYLVDGDRDSRRTLSGQLSERGHEVWPFGTSEAFLQLADKLDPGCLFLDIRIDGGRGMELIDSLTRRQAAWPIIALDAEPDVASAVAAMRAGAIDFLAKPADQDRLDQTLAAAQARLRAGLDAALERDAALEALARLTRREQEVAAALVAGHSNKKAAYDLGISVRTVEMHRAHLMTKIGVRSMAEAALLLDRAGFPGTPASWCRGRERRPAFAA